MYDILTIVRDKQRRAFESAKPLPLERRNKKKETNKPNECKNQTGKKGSRILKIKKKEKSVYRRKQREKQGIQAVVGLVQAMIALDLRNQKREMERQFVKTGGRDNRCKEQKTKKKSETKGNKNEGTVTRGNHARSGGQVQPEIQSCGNRDAVGQKGSKGTDQHIVVQCSTRYRDESKPAVTGGRYTNATLTSPRSRQTCRQHHRQQRSPAEP